jgi:tetratricopeptide (TPR) repeat protein
MLKRIRTAPFTDQAYHEQRVTALASEVARQQEALLGTSGGLGDSISRYRTAFQARPEDTVLHEQYGSLLLNGAGDAAQAERHWLAVTGSRPQSAEAWAGLAKSYIGQRRFDEAISCYRKIIELRRGEAEAMMNIGVAMKLQQRFPEALDQMRRALAMDPYDPSLHFNFATCLVAQDAHSTDDRDLAIAHYRKALELDPTHGDSRANLARLLYFEAKALARQDRASAAALAKLNEAIEYDPGFLEAHLGLAEMSYGMGKRESAIKHLRDALEIKPDQEAARGMLQELLAADPARAKLGQP